MNWLARALSTSLPRWLNSTVQGFRDLAMTRTDGSHGKLLYQLDRVVLIVNDWAMAPLADTERDFPRSAMPYGFCRELIRGNGHAQYKRNACPKLILCGEASFRRALKEHAAYFHAKRQHKGKRNILCPRADLPSQSRQSD